MYLDRGVLSSLVPILEKDHDLHLSELQAGVLGSVFMFGFMIASPFFAYSSQTVHPFTLIAIGIAVWGGSVLLAAVSRTFWMLTIARTLSGIGEASFVCLASPILLAIAPAARKNLWISIYYSAITVGFALGYVVAPPVAHGFGGWYYIFYMEAVASVPFVLLALFAYKDPSLIFKKEVKVSIATQFRKLAKNKVYVFLVLGYGAYMFTVGGISFWGPSMLQKQFDKGETAASLGLGAITILSGLVATVIGSMQLEKMIRSYRLSFEQKQISEKKYNFHRAEKACKLIMMVTAVACCVAMVGAVIGPTIGGPAYEGPFVFFFICLGAAEFLLFL